MVRMRWMSSVMISIVGLSYAGSASAQLTPRTGRFSLDAELLSAGRVHVDPGDDGEETKTSVIGIGANQLGSSRVYLPTTPLGLGAGYVFDEQWIIGLRLGFGYDWVSPENGPNERVVALSAIPKITWVPTGDEAAKFFVDLGPLFQYNRFKAGDSEQNLLAGGFEVGAGTMRFMGEHASVDIGAYFQGRFGKLKDDFAGMADADDDMIRDLRGVLRIGGSLWTNRREREEQPSDHNRSLETRTPPPAGSTLDYSTPPPPASEPVYVAPPGAVVPPTPVPPPAPTTPGMPPSTTTPPPTMGPAP